MIALLLFRQYVHSFFCKLESTYLAPDGGTGVFLSGPCISIPVHYTTYGVAVRTANSTCVHYTTYGVPDRTMHKHVCPTLTYMVFLSGSCISICVQYTTYGVAVRTANSTCVHYTTYGVPDRTMHKHVCPTLKGLSHQIFKSFLSSTILNQYFLYGR